MDLLFDYRDPGPKAPSPLTLPVVDPGPGGYEPTTARPGSDEKIAVMAGRAERRLPVFHPLDVTLT